MENHRQKVEQLFQKYKKHPAFLITLSVMIIVAAVGFYHLLEKDITVIDDTDTINISTRKNTVEEALKENNISLIPEDVIEPSLDTPIKEGMEIKIKRAEPINIIVDGSEKELLTATRNVEGIIQEAGIEVGEMDRVIPHITANVGDDNEIRIIRIREEIITEDEALEYATEKIPNNNLEKGTTKVVQKGEKGLKKNEVKIIYEDGEETKREILKEEVVMEPKDEIIQVGSKDTISTSRGTTRFEKAMVVTATAYSEEDPGVSNRTSLGKPLEKGVIAVDPSVIPYYTKIYVPGYGFGQALDTGGAIKGNRIDLAMDSRAEALRYGRRQVKIYLLGR